MSGKIGEPILVVVLLLMFLSNEPDAHMDHPFMYISLPCGYLHTKLQLHHLLIFLPIYKYGLMCAPPSGRRSSQRDV